jgi:hypothetical protein
LFRHFGSGWKEFVLMKASIKRECIFGFWAGEITKSARGIPSLYKYVGLIRKHQK